MEQKKAVSMASACRAAGHHVPRRHTQTASFRVIYVQNLHKFQYESRFLPKVRFSADPTLWRHSASTLRTVLRAQERLKAAGRTFQGPQQGY